MRFFEILFGKNDATSKLNKKLKRTEIKRINITTSDHFKTYKKGFISTHYLRNNFEKIKKVYTEKYALESKPVSFVYYKTPDNRYAELVIDDIPIGNVWKNNELYDYILHDKLKGIYLLIENGDLKTFYKLKEGK